jgi:hypothetical protein
LGFFGLGEEEKKQKNHERKTKNFAPYFAENFKEQQFDQTKVSL